MKLNSVLIRKLRERAKNNFYFFAKGILDSIKPESYIVSHVHGPVCQFLSSPHRFTLLNLPRSFLKTTIGTVAYAIWRSIRNPDIRILIAMNTLENAKKRLHEIRMHWEKNRLLRALFPELVPDFNKVRWGDECCEINRPHSFPEGTYEAIGVGGSVTSRHYDVVIEDDLVHAKKDDLTGEEAVPSREDIEKAIGWHKLVNSLFVNPAKGEIHIRGTRWAHDDHLQYVIDNEPRFKVFKMAAVKLNENGDIIRDEEGRYIPTYPERFPYEVLREIELSQGPYIFSTQYLNQPMDISRMDFLPEQIKTFEHAPAKLDVYITVDPAMGESDKGDYAVAVACGWCVVEREGREYERCYVLDYKRGHWTPDKFIQQIINLTRQYQTTELVRGIWVETGVGVQGYVKFYLQKKIDDLGLRVPVYDLKLKKSKDAKEIRIRSLQPLVARGDFLIRPWMVELRKEMLSFPGRYDDILDAISMQRAIARPARKKILKKNDDPLLFDNILKELTRGGKGIFDYQKLITV